MKLTDEQKVMIYAASLQGHCANLHNLGNMSPAYLAKIMGDEMIRCIEEDVNPVEYNPTDGM